MVKEIAEKGFRVADFWTGPMGEALSRLETESEGLNLEEIEIKFKPTTTDFLLRKRFWELTNRAKNEGIVLHKLSDFYNGICMKPHIYNGLFKDPVRLYWITRPFKSNEELMEFGFTTTMHRVLNEVLTMPVTEKTAPTLLKALAFFADRVMGPVVQNVNLKSLSATVDLTKQMNGNLDQKSLNAKYEELQKKLSSAILKDVTPADVDE